MYLIKKEETVATAFTMVANYQGNTWRKASSLQLVCEVAAKQFGIEKPNLVLLTQPHEIEAVCTAWFNRNFRIQED